MPLAGLLAALLAWAILEPYFADTTVIGGEVVLVNSQPVDFAGIFRHQGRTSGAVTLTVGRCEVHVVPGVTRLEPGADGQRPWPSIDRIEVSDTLEAAGEPLGRRGMVALAVRPATPDRARSVGVEALDRSDAGKLLFLPVTAVLIALALLVAEGVSSRNWVRMTQRVGIGTLLSVVFSFLALVPAGVLMTVATQVVLKDTDYFTAADMPPTGFLVYTAARSMAWAAFGAALGLGMNLARSSKHELRNSVVGGVLGGALGGAMFDSIDRFGKDPSIFTESSAARLVGLLLLGLCVGLFMALVDRLAREAWLRVRTGPLAGKAFVLYKSPTKVGSSPHADIYLFKDEGISPVHAAIHRVGNRFEIEDLDSRSGVRVGGRAVRRHRLQSGDSITLGGTILEFEERSKAGAGR